MEKEFGRYYYQRFDLKIGKSKFDINKFKKKLDMSLITAQRLQKNAFVCAFEKKLFTYIHGNLKDTWLEKKRKESKDLDY